MNADYERLRLKLIFDPLDIDQELIELPMLMIEAAEYTSDALSERDRCKNELDLVQSETADALRTRPVTDGKGGMKTRSEAQIETEVPLFQSVQDAVAKLEQAKHRLALWQALVDALRAKRDSLKIYADLTISGYLTPNSAIDKRKADIRNASNARKKD